MAKFYNADTGGRQMNELVKTTGKLGFGLMRLPRTKDGIDIPQTEEMVDLFMNAGFTYFDTAWAYDGSEEAIRQALVERYPRSSFTLATKNAAWIDCRTREEAAAQLDTSLKRTGAGYFDFYMLHNIGANRTKVFDDFNMWEFLQEQKASGRIRNIGFSFHDTADKLEPLLEEHPDVDFVQLQINYADWKDQKIQAKANYETACRHNIPVIIMEPVKGGLLSDPPRKVKELLHSADPSASCASWAIRFAASLDNVITVLSGMSSVQQMQDNLSYMKNFHKLNAEEQDVLTKARELISRIPLIPCTSCDYCAKVCPNQIGISGTFSALNQYRIYRNKDAALNAENWAVIRQGKKRAIDCVKCGLCEEACPQHILIRDYLDEAVKAFSMTAKESSEI